MHFPAEATRKTFLFFTVLTLWAVSYGVPFGDRTLNLRLGFDLTPGKNGVPSLRIRDFEENERYPRAVAEDPAKVKPAIRADSFSESKEDKGRNDETSKEVRRQSSESDDDDSDGKNRHKSTKGINPEEYEPEDSVKLHGKYKNDDDDVSDGDGDRRKRHVNYFETKKRRSYYW